MITDITTTENYWDCECMGNIIDFIHPKSQTICTKCNAHQDDMPDSRIDEVAQMSNVIKICKDCLRAVITHGLDTVLFNKMFTIVDVPECFRTKEQDRTYHVNEFSICPNDCANWPPTTSNTPFGCACECHSP
jgi:hypothetical protein